jgi:hypothetical protein
MRTIALVATVAALAGCGEDPQIANRVKQDAALNSGTGVGAPFTAPGWKAGDRNSWEQHLKTRTQMGQNDYVKVQ